MDFRFESLKSAAAFLAAAAILTAAGSSDVRASDAPRFILAQAVEKVSGEGVLKGVNAEERKLMMTHEPIPALKWPAMTMAFGVAPGVDLSGLEPGAKVTFTLSRDAKGLYVIDSIAPVK